MLVSFEGIDGCGKSTQAHLLHDRLVSRGYASKFVHYPDYDGEVGTHLVAPFLRGEFGSVETVNPWLVGLIFSVDRITSAATLKTAMGDGLFVVTDRYLLSNIAFQGAKVTDPVERRQLQDWIKSFEISQGVPEPDQTFLLDLPARHAHVRDGDDVGDARTYLAGVADIHEEDLELQDRVAREYRDLSRRQGDRIKVLACLDSNQHRKTPEQLSDEVWDYLVADGLVARR